MEVLDSEEEELAREAEWEAAEAVRITQRRRRLRRAAEQGRRIKEREARRTSEGPGAEAAPGYVRLSFRLKRLTAPSVAELETAFSAFEARVVSRSDAGAVLAVASEERALSCALAFHGWSQQSCSEATQLVYRSLRVVVAPVAAGGRALAGSRPTVAATRLRVVACDQGGSALI